MVVAGRKASERTSEQASKQNSQRDCPPVSPTPSMPREAHGLRTHGGEWGSPSRSSRHPLRERRRGLDTARSNNSNEPRWRRTRWPCPRSRSPGATRSSWPSSPRYRTSSSCPSSTVPSASRVRCSTPPRGKRACLRQLLYVPSSSLLSLYPPFPVHLISRRPATWPLFPAPSARLSYAHEYRAGRSSAETTTRPACQPLLAGGELASRNCFVPLACAYPVVMCVPTCENVPDKMTADEILVDEFRV